MYIFNLTAKYSECVLLTTHIYMCIISYCLYTLLYKTYTRLYYETNNYILQPIGIYIYISLPIHHSYIN